MRNFLKYTVLFIFFFTVSKHVSASHIIGGAFKIDMVNNIGSGAYYDIQLSLYRDDINATTGNPLPQSVTVGFYQVGTNVQVITKTLYLISGSPSFIPLGDPCYDPDTTLLRIEEGIYQNLSGSTVLLPNYSSGYYIQYETCCRNSVNINLSSPTSLGISVMAVIPDPSEGQNSTPDFGPYPFDAYFCIQNIKKFTWPVTDPDGDSLVFSLVAPLDRSLMGMWDTGPATGAYPSYPTCPFVAPFNVSNMIGGTPTMTINSETGEITAAPSIGGYFSFAVRVEEYRNGVKLGEVRRDVQYASEPCQVATIPEVTVNDDPGSSNVIQIDAYLDDQICFDVEVSVLDPDDSIFLQIGSATFDLVNTYVAPTQSGSNMQYLNWQNVSGQTFSFTAPQLQSNGYLGGEGKIGMRYCWEPPCEFLDEVLDLTLSTYTVSCAGILTVDKDLEVHVMTEPYPDPQPIPNTFSPNGDNVNDYFQLTPFDINDPSIKYNDPCFDEMSVFIYNRWGQKVFESNDPLFKWDGTKNGDGSSDCNPGSYMVIIKGTYGSSYDSVTGLRIPNPVEDEYFIQLFR